jgi:gluconate kinase
MKHVFVVFGPTGCGKSTIGKYVSSNSSYQFLEGDDVSLPPLVYHSLQRLESADVDSEV